MMTRNPHNVDKLRKVRMYLVKLFLYTSIGVALLAKTALSIHDHVLAEVVAEVRISAYEQAKHEFEVRHKEAIMKDHDFLNQACKAWWFDMTTLDRKLKIPPKPVKK